MREAKTRVSKRALVALSVLLSWSTVFAIAPVAGATSTWSTPVQASTTGFRGISCPSTTLCWAVGKTGYAVEWNGTSWGTPVQIGGTATAWAISCPSTTLCWAIGGGTHTTGSTSVIEWNGTSWGAPVQLTSGSHTFNAISCPSTTLCWAVGNGYANEWNGTSWGAATSSVGPWMLAVSCPSVSLCWASTSSSKPAEWNGTTWSEYSATDGLAAMGGISCPTTTLCWEVRTTSTTHYAPAPFGEAVEWNGSTWGTVVDVGSYALSSISCPSATLCWAAGATGYVAEWNGSTWGAEINIDGTTPLYAVSCPAVYLCWTGDNTGHALQWKAPMPPSISAVTAPNFAVTLNGTSGTASSTEVVSQSNSTWKSGWSVSVTGTPFVCQSGPCAAGAILTSSAIVASAPTDACAAGTACTLATNLLTAYPITVPLAATPPAATKIYSVQATTGVGNQTVAISWRIHYGSSAFAGQYRSTWAFTLADGP